MPSNPVDLYNSSYAYYANEAEKAVRTETYGEDIGQSSWITAEEWLRFGRQLGVNSESHVLEVGSGSGGPALYLANHLGCRVTGIDINEHGIRNANALARTRGLADRVRFELMDASQPLPFEAETFDAVISNDAIIHIAGRLAVLQDWRRVLRRGGRLLFTDAMVVTGLISHEEVATRSSIGFYQLVPPGLNESLVRQAGFELLSTEDVTSSAADVAERWHAARVRHCEALVSLEGETNFAGLQRFLASVHQLSAERRLSRFSYLATKPES
jgi:cyclopropane fatty-acyl-phospholipid synthase-like methyltransferase